MMIRQGLQRLVRLAPGAARLGWLLVPSAMKRWLAPLIHPIAAGRRGGGHVLEVPMPDEPARLYVVNARSTAGAPDPHDALLHVRLGAETSGEALVRRGVVEAAVLCESNDARRASFTNLGWRVINDEGLYQSTIDHAVEAAFPSVSIIVPTRNQPLLLEYCLAAIVRNTAWPNLEVIIVDNGSEKPTRSFEHLEWKLSITVLRNEHNAGFARAANQGITASSGAFVVLLNDDTVVGPGWLSRLVAHLEANPRLGLVCPVTNEIGSDARIAVQYDTLEEMERFAVERGVAFGGALRETRVVPLYCAAARRAVLAEVGGLDERYAIGMFEDDDLSRTLRRRGYELAIADDAFVHHVGQASFSRLTDAEYLAIWEANKRRYESKWGERWQPPEVPARE